MKTVMLALIVGLVIGAISGIFATMSICLLAPFVIVGSILAFILSIFIPPLREYGLAFVFFSGGWIMRVHPENLRQDLKNLMINTETRDFMVGEAEQLYQVIEEVGGPLSTDGGYLGDDIYGSMPQLGWERLIKLFFRT